MQINKNIPFLQTHRREIENEPFAVVYNYRKMRIIKKIKELKKNKMEKLKM